MSEIFASGVGSVSPAGWGISALMNAVSRNEPLPRSDLPRPGWPHGFKVRPVPAPPSRPDFFAHPRLRRSSPISKFAVAAALEAMDGTTIAPERLGIICCVLSGCANYTRRFFEEVLHDPALASPLLFPETVFNAPSSHLAALLGISGINYTLAGDPGTFLNGLTVARDWLASECVDGCVVVGAEELDWTTADAFRLFSRRMILSEGAGAVFLTRAASEKISVRLDHVTTPALFLRSQNVFQAAERMRKELPASSENATLCLGTQGIRRFDQPEEKAWKDWSGARLEPKKILGEGLSAASAWQCVAAISSLSEGPHSEALVSVVGCHQQAVGARFVKI